MYSVTPSCPWYTPVCASASVASHSMSGSITESTASMSRRPNPSYAVRSLSASSLKRSRAYMLGSSRGPRVGYRGRATRVVALREVDAEPAEHPQRRLVAHELRDGALAEAVRDLDYRLDGQLVGLGRRDLADEIAVDLQVVERQVLEVIERSETGAEVVECERAAQLP